ncbi:hypothetical protein Acr_00g0103700 [Actinidia rufa]|uniref:Retrovirus-related Pol polyprotein from transposon TNT 1-94-like beta-barrel domain-containing protein n=1 Tax=Actinidia rufa TaxID=165716 RepID=A0A7J0E0R5_9ERIC|nr:hypothetical protein Acr_00g0103700 [Actinidia rufa]
MWTASGAEENCPVCVLCLTTCKFLNSEPQKHSCSSRRYGAPTPNRIGNGVWTRPHAPFEGRRVRSVSATRPGEAATGSHALARTEKECHALPRTRRVAHAHARASHAPSGLSTRLHAPEVEATRPHARTRHARRGSQPARLHAVPINATSPLTLTVDQPYTAATVVMAVDESDVLQQHQKMETCEERIWMANNTSSRVVGRGSVRFPMADGRSVTLTEVRHVPNLRKNLISIGMLDSKGCSFDASGEILRVSKGNKEMLWGKKIGGLYRLEGSVQTWEATVAQSQTRVVQPVQDVHREAQRKDTKSILRNCTAKGAATPKRVSFALDLIDQWRCSLQLCAQGRRDGATTTHKVTYFAAHPGGGHPSGGGAGHLGEKVQALRCGGAYTSVGSGVAR